VPQNGQDGHRLVWRELVNKAELIDALAVRLGEKKTATAALDAVLAEVQAAVTKGDKVSITGFGVFEKRVRAARMARNPRTGEAVKVKKTAIPAFRAGAGFKDMVASGKAPAGARKSTAKAAAKTTSRTTSRTTTAKATAAKATTARKTTAKATTAKATTAKATAAKATPAKKTAARKTTPATTARKTAATKAVAKKAPATRTAAKKAPARKAR
jgi:DNA-binding protein HU-beta